jgi:hypothetical protein
MTFSELVVVLTVGALGFGCILALMLRLAAKTAREVLRDDWENHRFRRDLEAESQRIVERHTEPARLWRVK